MVFCYKSKYRLYSFIVCLMGTYYLLLTTNHKLLTPSQNLNRNILSCHVAYLHKKT